MNVAKAAAIFIILIIALIMRAIAIIEFILAPTHIIINGPRATLGKEFIIVKYGSIILATVLLHQSIVAVISPITFARTKLIRVS